MHRGATYRARRRVRGRKAAQEAKGLRKGALPDKMTGTDTPRHTPGPGRRTGDAGLAWVDIGQTLGGIQHPARHARAQRVRGRGAGLSGGAHQVWERPSGEQGAAFVFRPSQTTLLEVGRSSSQSAFRIASLAVVEWARRGGDDGPRRRSSVTSRPSPRDAWTAHPGPNPQRAR